MMRTIYRWLVWLHPPWFRREFAAEMLWVFDQAAETDCVRALLLDAVVSLARQWVLRSGGWKLAAAAGGAILQVTAGGLAQLIYFESHRNWHVAAVPLPLTTEMVSLIRLALWSTGGVGLLVLLLSTWLKRFAGRRIRNSPRSYSICSS